MDPQPPVAHPVNEGPNALRMEEFGEVDGVDGVDGMDETGRGCPWRDLPVTQDTQWPSCNSVSGFPTSWTGHLLMKEEPW
jgi:hypothetical protein